ncbi:hypothetical protein DFJ73DRAFT_961780 [Zopfochytrium polystomum]|nr:hypothetical protein DFJ73DRAFT_961780 [Zopfochytrium polystomum]
MASTPPHGSPAGQGNADGGGGGNSSTTSRRFFGVGGFASSPQRRHNSAASTPQHGHDLPPSAGVDTSAHHHQNHHSRVGHNNQRHYHQRHHSPQRRHHSIAVTIGTNASSSSSVEHRISTHPHPPSSEETSPLLATANRSPDASGDRHVTSIASPSAFRLFDDPSPLFTIPIGPASNAASPTYPATSSAAGAHQSHAHPTAGLSTSYRRASIFVDANASAALSFATDPSRTTPILPPAAPSIASSHSSSPGGGLGFHGSPDVGPPHDDDSSFDSHPRLRPHHLHHHQGQNRGRNAVQRQRISFASQGDLRTSTAEPPGPTPLRSSLPNTSPATHPDEPVIETPDLPVKEAEQESDANLIDFRDIPSDDHAAFFHDSTAPARTDSNENPHEPIEHVVHALPSDGEYDAPNVAAVPLSPIKSRVLSPRQLELDAIADWFIRNADISGHILSPRSLRSPTTVGTPTLRSPPQPPSYKPPYTDEPPRRRARDPAASRILFYSDCIGPLHAPTLSTLPFPSHTPLPHILHSGAFWIDVCAPTPDDLDAFAEVFGLHPLTVEDVQLEDTREKCEVFPGYYFVCYRTLGSDGDEGTDEADAASIGSMGGLARPVNLYMVVFRECVISFHAKPLPHPPAILRRITQLQTYGLSISPDWLSYALLDDVTDSFQPHLAALQHEVDAVDELVLILRESEQADMLRRIGGARRRVLGLMRLLGGKVDVLRAVGKRLGEKVGGVAGGMGNGNGGGDAALYLGDIQDHVITMLQNLAHHDTTLNRAHSTYLAQISIEITQASNRTNDFVMRMTALASVLIPLNVITGLWGMNVKVPGQDEESLVWFAGIVAGMGVVVGVTVWMMRKYELV